MAFLTFERINPALILNVIEWLHENALTIKKPCYQSLGQKLLLEDLRRLKKGYAVGTAQRMRESYESAQLQFLTQPYFIKEPIVWTIKIYSDVGKLGWAPICLEKTLERALELRNFKKI